MTDYVTRHAIHRYQKRVANLPDEQVIEALSTPAIKQAVAFGAASVILGTGHRVIISGGKIVTVTPKSTWRSTLRKREQ